MKLIFNLILIFTFGLAVFAGATRAQAQVPPPMPAAQMFTDAQLQQLVGPIALYPDPLIAVMLPAATLPTEIVMADRYVSGGGDPNQIDQQSWDPNVQALARYPAVLTWMDNNLNWTTQLGEAFQNQQDDVMNAIQELRASAYNLGNLQSTPQQQVVNDNGYIEILPANPDDLYVPQYQPDQVYYQTPYAGTSFVTFGNVGFAVGPWLCGDFDWRHRHLIHWDRDHPRPSGWWHQNPQSRANYIAAGHGTVWNPANRGAYSPARGDRGYYNRGYYNNPAGTAPAANRHETPPMNRPGTPAGVIRPGTPPAGNRPAPAGHPGSRNSYNNNLPWTNPAGFRPLTPAPAPTGPPNAFIGIQSTHDTRDYSDRGERSMETMPSFHNLGAFHSFGAPAGGGGGSEGVYGGRGPAVGASHGGGAPAGGGSHDGGASAGGGSHSGGGGRH